MAIERAKLSDNRQSNQKSSKNSKNKAVCRKIALPYFHKHFHKHPRHAQDDLPLLLDWLLMVVDQSKIVGSSLRVGFDRETVPTADR